MTMTRLLFTDGFITRGQPSFERIVQVLRPEFYSPKSSKEYGKVLNLLNKDRSAFRLVSIAAKGLPVKTRGPYPRNRQYNDPASGKPRLGPLMDCNLIS